MEDVEKRITEKFQQAMEASASTLHELLKKMDGISGVNSKLEEIEGRQAEHVKIVQYLQAKMDLSMKSLAQVSQDQTRLANLVNVVARNACMDGVTGTGDGLIGPRPTGMPIGPQIQNPPPPVIPHGMGPPPPPPIIPHGVGNGDGLPRRGEGESDASGRRGGLPKWEFPVFDGEDARIWVDKCEAYFALFFIPDAFRVSAVSLHLKGKAAHWFQAYRDSLNLMDWAEFRVAVLEEFEVSTHSDKMQELLTLRQTGSVLEYKTHFEKLVYHIKLFDKAISDTFLVTQFVLGLKWELRGGVEVQFPKTVSMAAQLAFKHEAL